MNIVVSIMLLFALIGFIDKMFQLNLGLSDSFDKGLMTMGTMSISIVGICSVGVTFIQRNLDIIEKITSILPFDPSLPISMLLAPDMGGLSISRQLCSDYGVFVLNGIILSSILGQTLSFQFPVFLSMIDKKDHPIIMKGFILGIIVVPAGLISAQALLRLPFLTFLYQFFPILIACVLIAGGLLFFSSATIRIFTVFAKLIQYFTYLMFLIAVTGLFIPSLAYADMTAIHDSVTTILKSSIIVAGSLVLSELILKFFRRHLAKLAAKLGINEISMVGLLLSCATSLAIFPLFPRMDQKGKMLNAAFAVSGSYLIGGQLGYVSSMSDRFSVTVYLISKIVCGLLSIFLLLKLYDKLNRKSSDKVSF